MPTKTKKKPVARKAAKAKVKPKAKRTGGGKVKSAAKSKGKAVVRVKQAASKTAPKKIKAAAPAKPVAKASAPAPKPAAKAPAPVVKPEVKPAAPAREEPDPKKIAAAAARFSKSELDAIREQLKGMLDDVREGIANEASSVSTRDLAHINDSSDVASDSAESDLSLRLAETEGVEAEEIERAIEKIPEGTYGVCDRCTQPVPLERMRFLPWATLCVRCQSLAEIRRKRDGMELDDLEEGDESGEEA